MMNSIKKLGLALVCGFLLAAMPTQAGNNAKPAQSISTLGSVVWYSAKYTLLLGAYALFDGLGYGSPKDFSEQVTFGLLSEQQVIALRKFCGLAVKPKMKVTADIKLPDDKILSQEEITNRTNCLKENARLFEKTNEFKFDKAYDPEGFINKPLKALGFEFGAKTYDLADKFFVGLIIANIISDLNKLYNGGTDSLFAEFKAYFPGPVVASPVEKK